MSLETHGYALLPSLVPDSMVHLCRNAILYDANSGLLKSDNTVPGSLAGSNNVALKTLQAQLRPKLEKETGKALYHTYVYYRIYQKGAKLLKHKDRPACEYSITLNLGGSNDVDWPIYVESLGRDVPVSLKPGDALLYKGCEIPHWRDTYTGTEQVQAFIHYVDQNGPYHEHKDDAVRLKQRAADAK